MARADDSPAHPHATDDVAGQADDTAAHASPDAATRRDPTPDAVPGRDDAGAQGRDREHGGWGDRGIGGGRAGGTGL